MSTNFPYDTSLQSIQFYLTPPHECSYLAERQANTLFVDPNTKLTPLTYAHLLSMGFRRSGDHVYRPHCSPCKACVPIRIPVEQFCPNRSQKRCLRVNQNLQVSSRPAHFNLQQFQLYKRYIHHRHTGGSMDDPDPEKYIQFLSSSWCDTIFYEFQQNNRLVAVAVVDHLPNALSAVYTFFDPDLPKLSLGMFGVLWQVLAAQRLQLPWAYMGYWIDGCQKMQYKENYRPIEFFLGGRWIRYKRGENIPRPSPEGVFVTQFNENLHYKTWSNS